MNIDELVMPEAFIEPAPSLEETKPRTGDILLYNPENGRFRINRGALLGCRLEGTTEVTDDWSPGNVSDPDETARLIAVRLALGIRAAGTNAVGHPRWEFRT